MRLALMSLMALMLSGSGVFADTKPCTCDEKCAKECPSGTCSCECGCKEKGGKCAHGTCQHHKAEKTDKKKK